MVYSHSGFRAYAFGGEAKGQLILATRNCRVCEGHLAMRSLAFVFVYHFSLLHWSAPFPPATTVAERGCFAFHVLSQHRSGAKQVHYD